MASLNANLIKHVNNTNLGIQQLVSSKTIPLWINPNNSNFYNSNPYKAGDVVIIISDINKIYYLLRYYFKSIAQNTGLDETIFFEKNNPEIQNTLVNTLLYGGYITEDMYINPMTCVSTSEKGYGLYVSLKNQNYDMPTSSDSWFNLDMSETVESMQLQISRIISILTSNGYIDNIYGEAIDPVTNKPFNLDINKDENYLINRLGVHKWRYHFGDGLNGTFNDVDFANSELDKIQAEIESHINTTTSVMRNPFLLNGELVGNTLTIIQTTGQMFFYCILDATKFEKDTNITIDFTPNNISNIIVPFVLQTNNGIVTVDNPNTDKYVKIENNQCAWYAESFVSVLNDKNVSNNITLETTDGFEEANFNNNFNGFLDNAYIATYTPIGVEVREGNIGIHCSPVKEISRTNKSITIQLSSKYLWKYTGIAIALSGKCEVN